jgi:hypothetical protein
LVRLQNDVGLPLVASLANACRGNARILRACAGLCSWQDEFTGRKIAITFTKLESEIVQEEFNSHKQLHDKLHVDNVRRVQLQNATSISRLFALHMLRWYDHGV